MPHRDAVCNDAADVSGGAVLVSASLRITASVGLVGLLCPGFRCCQTRWQEPLNALCFSLYVKEEVGCTFSSPEVL